MGKALFDCGEILDEYTAAFIFGGHHLPICRDGKARYAILMTTERGHHFVPSDIKRGYQFHA